MTLEEARAKALWLSFRDKRKMTIFIDDNGYWVIDSNIYKSKDYYSLCHFVEEVSNF